MPEFTTDWSSRHCEKWMEYLAPLKDRPASGLELGTYEGRSAIWFLQNILTHPDSRLICIDGWWSPEVHKRFLANIIEADVFMRCEPRRGNTHNLLRGIRQRFDFIFVDADHKAPAVIQDAVLAWHNLNVGGILIFDDYLWTDSNSRNLPPKIGVDAFLATHEGQYELLHKEWQVIVRKLF